MATRKIEYTIAVSCNELRWAVVGRMGVSCRNSKKTSGHFPAPQGQGLERYQTTQFLRTKL